MNLPTQIIANYREGKISRVEFCRAWSDWQKSHGVNYDTKGYIAAGVLHLVYRAVSGHVFKGRIYFRVGKKDFSAPDVYTFRRKIDHELLMLRLNTA